MSKKPHKLSDEIRLAVDQCGMSRYRIAKILGLEESALCRFQSGKMLRQASLDALAALLDLHISRGAGFGQPPAGKPHKKTSKE